MSRDPRTVLPTPSQTVGPFYGYALPFPGGPDIAPAGHPDTLTVRHNLAYWRGEAGDAQGAAEPK